MTDKDLELAKLYDELNRLKESMDFAGIGFQHYYSQKINDVNNEIYLLENEVK